MPSELPPKASAAPAPPTGWRRVFMGPLRLRALWRLVLFVMLFLALATTLRKLAALLHIDLETLGRSGWSPGSFALSEGLIGVVLLAATLLLARIEHQSPARYGLPLRSAFGANFWEGSVWGFSAVSVLVAMIAIGGGYHANGFAFTGAKLVHLTLMWILAMVVLGVSEEIMFRGYALAALSDGISFWGAAIVLSIAFAAMHYFLKPMENLADALSVGLIGLFLCFSLRRTGSLWFAIGFHFAFDFAALPFYGAPNTGNGGMPIAGHLVAGVFGGPAWLTGGPRGAEASLLVFPVIVALFVLLHLRFPDHRFPTAPRETAAT